MISRPKGDRLLLQRLLSLAARRGWTLEEMARQVGRTKTWGSMVASGKIGRLQFVTRNNVRALVGDPDRGRDVNA